MQNPNELKLETLLRTILGSICQATPSLDGRKVSDTGATGSLGITSAAAECKAFFRRLKPEGSGSESALRSASARRAETACSKRSRVTSSESWGQSKRGNGDGCRRGLRIRSLKLVTTALWSEATRRVRRLTDKDVVETNLSLVQAELRVKFGVASGNEI